MIDILDKMYFRSSKKNNNLIFNFYSTILRFLIRHFSNLFLPLFYKFNKLQKLNLDESKLNKKLLIVSLTSFPKRINKVWIVIESLLRQKTKPNYIILWLSIKQFQSLEDLPKNLKKYQSLGLIIRFCEDDFGSHKKYFYVMQEYPNDVIITVDDDVIYNTNIIKKLVDLHKEFPQTICCNLASFIKNSNKKIDTYINWPTVTEKHEPSYSIIPIGVGGILYPPNCFDHEVFNSTIFTQISPLADDIWLNIMSRINNIPVAKTNLKSGFIPITYLKNITLNSKNVSNGLNDLQLNNIRNYLIVNRGIDPFDNL